MLGLDTSSVVPRLRSTKIAEYISGQDPFCWDEPFAVFSSTLRTTEEMKRRKKKNIVEEKNANEKDYDSRAKDKKNTTTRKGGQRGHRVNVNDEAFEGTPISRRYNCMPVQAVIKNNSRH